MGFSRRKKSNRQINGTTMIVPGIDSVQFGGVKIDNRNITKFRTGPAPTPTAPTIDRENPFIPQPPTPTPSSTPQPTPTITPTPSVTITSTPTVTPTPSVTVTITPTTSETPTPTLTPTPTPTTPEQLLLDIYPNASVAYSVRKLKGSYSGSAIRVRRSSDNTEQDIGFSGNSLDTASLTSFVGVGNGFITVWYDQSGNNNDAVQSTAANQPRIVSSGTINTINSNASLNFLSYTNWFTLTSSVSGGTDFSSFSVGQVNCADNLIYMASDESGANYLMTLSQFSNGDCENANVLQSRTRYGQYDDFFNSSQTLLESFSTGSTLTAYQNGVSKSLTLSSFSNSKNFNSIGRVNNSGMIYSQGNIQEIIFYPSNKFSDRVGIETNINDYFNIYP